MNRLTIGLMCSMAALAGCGNAQDRAEDRVEATAEANAAAAGTAVAALGLTERQLLDADLVTPGGVELGDVTAVLRNATGEVDRLLVEIEDSDPDRFVHVPIAGLTPVTRGDDTDLSTTMTAAQLAALPDAPLQAP